MIDHRRRQFVRASGAFATLAALGLAGRAGAQGVPPLENVKIVTGFPPGGTSDTLCRRVAEALKGSPYAKVALVENKPGAGGQIAVQSMKGAPTDGSVILQTPASMLMIYPHIYKSLAYNAFTDVTAVSLASTFDFGFCVGPAVPDSVKDVPGFLAWCKANPEKANYGSPGAGSVPHFIGVMMGRAGGVELKHVGYRGTQPAIQDLVAGQVQAVSGPVGEFTQQANAGKIRYLSVSGAARSRFAPNVPTLAELGQFDAILLGAIGPAIGDTRIPSGLLERGLLLKMRFGLDLIINFRPFRGVANSLAEGCEFAIVRENTEGEYSAIGGRMFGGTEREVVVQETVLSRIGVDRVLKFAFELARKTPKKHLTSATKSNEIGRAHV